MAEQLDGAWYVQTPDDETRLTILGNMWVYIQHMVDTIEELENKELESKSAS